MELAKGRSASLVNFAESTKEALNDMCNVNTIEELSLLHWQHLNIDLDLTAKIAAAVRTQNQEIGKTSIKSNTKAKAKVFSNTSSNLTKTKVKERDKNSKINISINDIYLATVVINLLSKSLNNYGESKPSTFILSLNKVASILFFGDTSRSNIYHVKQIIELLNKLKLQAGFPILDYKPNDNSEPQITVSSLFYSFVDNNLELDDSNYIRINKSLYRDVLSKVKSKPRVFAYTLELIFLTNKFILDDGEYSYNRTPISDKRLKDMFAPKAHHSILEIKKEAKKELKIQLGENYEQIIQFLVDHTISDEERRQFNSIKKKNLAKTEGWNKKKKAIAYEEAESLQEQNCPISTSTKNQNQGNSSSKHSYISEFTETVNEIKENSRISEHQGFTVKDADEFHALFGDPIIPKGVSL